LRLKLGKIIFQILLKLTIEAMMRVDYPLTWASVRPEEWYVPETEDVGYRFRVNVVHDPANIIYGINKTETVAPTSKWWTAGWK